MSKGIKQVMLRMPIESVELLEKFKAKTGTSINQQVINLIEAKRESILRKLSKAIDRK